MPTAAPNSFTPRAQLESDELKEAVILYDDDCSFCRWLLTKILAWDRDRRLRPVALQDQQADVLLRGMPHERKMDSWHLVTRDRIYSAGAAVSPLLSMLPWGKVPALIARLLPGTTEWIYRLLAGHRDRLGARLGEDACTIDRSSAGARPAS